MPSTLTPTTPFATAFEPDDDDRLIGRVLSRREVLALMGAASITVVAAACAPGSVGSGGTGAPASASGGAGATMSTAPTATAVAVASGLPSCVVVPQLTEGPYYVNEDLERPDIRIDTSDGSVTEGAVLRIDWVVSQVDGNACIPLEACSSTCGTATGWATIRTSGTSRDTICVATNTPTRAARHRSRRSTPADTRAARSTSTSRSAPTRPRRPASSSPRNSSSTTRSATRSMPAARMPPRASTTSRTPRMGSFSRVRA